MTFAYPGWNRVRISNKLKRQGKIVSPIGVCSIWLRHGLEVFQKLLKALATKSAQEGLVYSEA